MATLTPEAQHAVISDFCIRLALRPDGDRVRAQLAAAFVEHRRDLWLWGEPGATPEWIAGHVDELLATIDRLYGQALDGPMAHGFLDRMAWLPTLLGKLDPPDKQLDG